MTDNQTILRPPQQRVLAWWDVDMHIGAITHRKLTARPLKKLERALGHRVHVEGRDRYDIMPKGVWKFEAYNYLETSDPAWATYWMMRKLQPLSEWLQTSWQGYNWNASAAAEDPDGSTICALYFAGPEYHKQQSRFRSGGVLLRLADPLEKPFDKSEHFHRNARPVIHLRQASHDLANYNVNFTANIICGNKQDLTSYHLPRFFESMFPQGVSAVEIDARTHAGKPNIIHFQIELAGFYEHEAVAYCLGCAPSFVVKLDIEPSFHFVGERMKTAGYRDGIVAFEMRKIGNSVPVTSD